jgi:asparagine synthase (glutamine-hydrolysing)
VAAGPAPPAPAAARPPRHPGYHPPAPAKPDWLPNRDKRLVTADGGWARFPLRVDLVGAGADIPALAARRAGRFFAQLPDAPPDVAVLTQAGWYLYLSEKVVAVAQGRSFFVWEIQPSWWARRLSRFVVRTPYGIGLGDPTTMQLAIDEVGLPRILIASAVSAAGKVVGRRGLFYRVTGERVAAIDGPTQYSAYPANVSAKLAPADPAGVARQVSAAVRTSLPPELAARYRGAVIIDANDLGRTVLGHDTGLPPATLAAAFADNPLGQGREQTPVAVVFPLTAAADPGYPPGPWSAAGPRDHRPVRKIRLRTSARTSWTSRIRSSTARPR